MNRPTIEQKEVVKSIDILNFNSEPSDLELDEMSMAILNNVPGNTEIEEKKHLQGLEEKAINFSGTEWIRILYHAPFELMCDELKRRGQGYEEYRTALLGADEIMKQLKL